MGFGKIKLRPADTIFSRYIRTRDKWTCQHCGKFCGVNNSIWKLENSHYWGRSHENTRFEPDNCISLCFTCHKNIGHGDDRESYKQLMIKRLGQDRYDSLQIQANTTTKKDDTSVILFCKQALKELENIQ
jgi:hypothetical protein